MSKRTKRPSKKMNRKSRKTTGNSIITGPGYLVFNGDPTAPNFEETMAAFFEAMRIALGEG